jgi:hypothetical protein
MMLLLFSKRIFLGMYFCRVSLDILAGFKAGAAGLATCLGGLWRYGGNTDDTDFI